MRVHHAGTGRVQHLVHAPDDLDRPEAVEFVEDEVDDAASAAGGATAVAEGVHDRLDAFLGVGRHVGSAR